MIKFCKAYIPYGMYRSVEWNKPLQSLHPVKDAFLTGCGSRASCFFLPSEAFLTECRPVNAEHYRLFIFHYLTQGFTGDPSFLFSSLC
jgi:hypothetical protein